MERKAELFKNVLSSGADTLVIEVFKTNVSDIKQAEKVIRKLQAQFPNYLINFDLDDCDKILRVMAKQDCLELAEIILIVESLNHRIEILE